MFPCAFYIGIFGKHKPTARDYVQDGLIAMWDGIENAGWGVHDDQLTDRWCCLTGSDYDALGNTLFDNSSLILDGTHQLTTSILQNQQLVEIVIDPIDISSAQFVYDNTPIAVVHPCAFIQGGFVNFGHSKESINAAIVAEMGKHAYSFDWTENVGYKDGVSVESYSPVDYWGLTAGTFIGGANRLYYNGKIHSIRVYERSLTVAEIASNYAVDKARFGLT